MINKLSKKNEKINLKNKKRIEKIKDSGKISKKNVTKKEIALKQAFAGSGSTKQKNIKKITKQRIVEKNLDSDDNDSEISDAQEEDVNTDNGTEMDSGDESGEGIGSSDEGEDDENEDIEEVQDDEEQVDDKEDEKVEDEKPEKRKLFVRNLSANVKEHNIRQLFSSFGTVTNVFLNKNRDIGTCFVVMSTEEEASATRSLNNTNFMGKPLIVEEPIPFYIKKLNTRNTEDKTIYVQIYSLNATEDELKEKFSECGEIEFVKLLPPLLKNAIIKYKRLESLEKALQLNKTNWKNGFLQVRKWDTRDECDESAGNGYRILIQNMDDSVSIKQIKETFSSCGPISFVRVYSEKNNKQTCYVTFNKQISCRRAMNFYNNLKETDLKVSIDGKSQKNASNGAGEFNITISNIPIDCDIGELESFFSPIGKICKINLNEMAQKALITFTDAMEPKNLMLKKIRNFLAANKFDSCVLTA